MLRYFVKWLLLVVFSQSIFGFSESEREIVIQKNDEYPNFMLGGYFGIWKKGSSRGECGKIDQKSVYLLEAMKYAIRRINANRDILFGATLGYRIYATCGSLVNLRSHVKSFYLYGGTVGIIGPATSDEAILASPIFGVFRIPLVSYSASSIDLNDKFKYFSVFRTIPSDDIKNRAVVDILKQFNWTYISAVNSNGNYGQRGMDDLISKLNDIGICTASRYILPEFPNEKDFQAVIRGLTAEKKANVVVLITTPEDTLRLMKAAKVGRNFSWVLVTTWTPDKNTLQQIKEVLNGSLMLSFAGIDNLEYRKYFMAKKPQSNRAEDTWLKAFWQNAFNCSWNQGANTTICSGKESLNKSNFFEKYAPSDAVIDAVNTVTCALRNVITQICPIPGKNRTICVRKLNLRKIDKIRSEIGVLFYQGKSLCNESLIRGKRFDSDRALYRDIEVINFDGQNYRTVGTWKLNTTTYKGTLKIESSKITWYKEAGKPPVSSCSLPCKKGEILIKNKVKQCCHTCKSCDPNSYTYNNTCKPCKRLQIPNDQRTACKKLKIHYPTLKSKAVQVTLAGSILGLILITAVAVLFIIHGKSIIVKASSRELTAVIIIGLYLCFTQPLIFYWRPSVVICGLRKFIFGIAPVVCYTPLMLKLIRIYRIFNTAKIMVSMPHFVSPKSQMILCVTLIGIQLLLGVMWVTAERPAVVHDVIYNEYVAETCKSDTYTIIISLIPCFCLIFISTIFAFKTRKLPKNYNEAFSIAVTMYTNCFLWAIFIPLILWLRIKDQNPFTQIHLFANFNNVAGIVSVLFLFGPKVRRLFLQRQADGFSRDFVCSGRKDYSINNSADISLESIVAKLEDQNYQYARFYPCRERIRNVHIAKRRARTNTF